MGVPGAARGEIVKVFVTLVSGFVSSEAPPAPRGGEQARLREGERRGR